MWATGWLVLGGVGRSWEELGGVGRSWEELGGENEDEVERSRGRGKAPGEGGAERRRNVPDLRRPSTTFDDLRRPSTTFDDLYQPAWRGPASVARREAAGGCSTLPIE